MPRRGFIGVDLDGTLAQFHKWESPEHIGEPVPKMLERVRFWLDMGVQVKIFTARIWNPDHVAPIRSWLDNLGLQEVGITNVKERDMVEFWDDRCVQVEQNTGYPLVADDVDNDSSQCHDIHCCEYVRVKEAFKNRGKKITIQEK